MILINTISIERALESFRCQDTKRRRVELDDWEYLNPGVEPNYFYFLDLVSLCSLFFFRKCKSWGKFLKWSSSIVTKVVAKLCILQALRSATNPCVVVTNHENLEGKTRQQSETTSQLGNWTSFVHFINWAMINLSLVTSKQEVTKRCLLSYWKSYM